jgi:flagellar hook assembly protein FlgD
MDRVTHLRNVLAFLGNTIDLPVTVGPNGFENSLFQNRPNPFNTTTTIEFTVEEQGPVKLQIYNVAGQLVRTLVDEVRSPGEVHSAVWDGRSNAGQRVSSGVYFYKFVTGDFVNTKKMVLLK